MASRCWGLLLFVYVGVAIALNIPFAALQDRQELTQFLIKSVIQFIPAPRDCLLHHDRDVALVSSIAAEPDFGSLQFFRVSLWHPHIARRADLPNGDGSPLVRADVPFHQGATGDVDRFCARAGIRNSAAPGRASPGPAGAAVKSVLWPWQRFFHLFVKLSCRGRPSADCAIFCSCCRRSPCWPA